MGIFDDYISGLEGQTEVDPLKVVADLHGIHTTELGTREAKIEQQNEALRAKDAEIEKRENELKAQKALNFDLAMSQPKEQDHGEPRDENAKPDGGTIRIADLFTPKVRNRSGY